MTLCLIWIAVGFLTTVESTLKKGLLIADSTTNLQDQVCFHKQDLSHEERRNGWNLNEYFEEKFP